MCCRKHRVNGPCCTTLTLPSYFFINETSSLMNQVSFGTVIPCIGREVQDQCGLFWSRSLKISIFWVHLGAFDPLTILKLSQMYCYISKLMKHIDLTINLISPRKQIISYFFHVSVYKGLIQHVVQRCYNYSSCTSLFGFTRLK